MGDREVDVIKSYATYDYDPVLGQYYQACSFNSDMVMAIILYGRPLQNPVIFKQPQVVGVQGDGSACKCMT